MSAIGQASPSAVHGRPSTSAMPRLRPKLCSGANNAMGHLRTFCPPRLLTSPEDLPRFAVCQRRTSCGDCRPTRLVSLATSCASFRVLLEQLRGRCPRRVPGCLQRPLQKWSPPVGFLVDFNNEARRLEGPHVGVHDGGEAALLRGHRSSSAALGSSRPAAMRKNVSPL